MPQLKNTGEVQTCFPLRKTWWCKKAMQIDVAGQLLGMGAQSRVHPGGQANEAAQEEEGWERGLGREQLALPRRVHGGGTAAAEPGGCSPIEG